MIYLVSMKKTVNGPFAIEIIKVLSKNWNKKTFM